MNITNLAERLSDALSDGLAGSLKPPAAHPVTLPDVLIQYEQKDITADIRPYFLSLGYTDYLEGQSDEIQLELEDTDGRWLRSWYPNQGDKLALQLGDQFTGMVDLGEFEIAEIEYSHPPSVVSLKALSTGIGHANRTLKPKAYEHTTLADIVRQVAGRLKLSVTGEVADIKIGRITQYQERDVEFLARLAREYGHSFKIVGKTLVFTRNDKLAAQAAVALLLPEDIKTVRLRDLIKGVPQEAVVSGYDAKAKTVRRQSRKHKPLRPKAKRAATTDTLKITANRGESDAQLAARADAALSDASHNQVAGDITLFGNAKLVAGQIVRLKGFGQFSGRYLVKQSRHELRRSTGYTTSLEVKMVEYIADESEGQPERPSENPNKETQNAAGL
ncbi:phage protein [Neisseria bacilliformis ATCC BAA-1200]|uniref:Phage protein n=1 Tax=Neisseria bacilliformis ATCC BAA-1200 TaxID=888742 RepID=F2BEW1_9NEIS|nr:contractile injection system protein, VgrG/Pvc8 family [Neisseria bacilliformis]EGF09640.1 phage protein [Neisseria bacilliformis ATCC BAA-1200]QMT46909.1 hypothetical protein H3L91_08190 [Neisseria bacilliformis]